MASTIDKSIQQSSNSRRASLDFIRIFACLCVLVCHTKDMLIIAGSPFASICTVLGYLGVPLFAILTGYLFLDRVFDGPYLERFFKRNFLPLVVAFEIWNIVWYLCTKVPVLLEGDWYVRSLGVTLRAGLFVGPADCALWYLHLCIALYLGIPIVAKALQWLTENKKNAYTVLLIVCLVLFGTALPTLAEYAPLLDERLGMSPVIGMNIFDGGVWGGSVWMIYLVAGYVTKRGLFRRIPMVALAIAVVALAVVSTGLAAYGMLLGRYSNIFLVALGILVFELFDRAQDSLAKRTAVEKALGCLSKYAFPVYMVHLWVGSLVLYALRLLGVGKAFMLGLPLGANAFAYLVFLILWFAASCVVVKLISYIPGTKKWALLWK